VKRFSRILACTDFSEPGNRAIETAFSLAEKTKTTVVAAHILEALPIPNPMYAHYYPTNLWDPEVMEQAEAKAREELEAMIPDKSKSAGVAFELVATHGQIVDEILRIAEDSKADLIVLGTHGRGGLGHLILGSVAERVVRLAKCPVLTVH
jgi:nucleotide-binding universal stress UspA family protein